MGWARRRGGRLRPDNFGNLIEIETGKAIEQFLRIAMANAAVEIDLQRRAGKNFRLRPGRAEARHRPGVEAHGSQRQPFCDRALWKRRSSAD